MVMARPTRAKRLSVKCNRNLSGQPLAWLLSCRVLVLGAIPALFAATMIAGIFVLLTPPRLSLRLEVAPGGAARIAWLLPGGNLWDAGMHPGDHVLSLDGRPPGPQDGESWAGHQAVVREADGQIVSADANTTGDTGGSWPLLVLSPWFFLFGVLVYLRAGQRAVRAATYGLFTLTAFALALGPVADSNRLVVGAVAERVAVPLFAASFAFFFLIFPVERIARRGTIAVFAPAIVAGMLSVFGTFVPVVYPPVYAVWLALLVLYLCLGVAYAVYGWTSATEPGARGGTRIIALGALLSALPFVALSLGPSLLGGAALLRPEQAVLGIAVLPIAFTYAILRYQAVAVQLIQRWLLRSLIWGGLMGGYAMAAFLVWQLLGSTTVTGRTLAPAAALFSLAVSLSFPRLYGPLRHAVDRQVFHDAYDYRSSLHEISQGLSLGAGFDTMGRSLPSTLARLMDLEFAALLAYEGDLPRCLGADGPMPPNLVALGTVLLEDPQEQPGPRALDAGSGTVLLVPLRAEGVLAGCLCLGPKRNGELFSGEDETLLQTLSGHLAAAIRNAQLGEELRAKVAALDALNDRLQHAQEEERVRFVAEIHDGPLQSALHLQRRIAADGRSATEQHLFLSESVIHQLRALCMAVRPRTLTEFGLAAALELLADDLEQHSGIPITLEAEAAIEDLPMSAEAELVLYRAAQEALNNALKHAHASELRVTMDFRHGAVELAVLDDGDGFEMPATSRGFLAAGHLGLAGLRQRVERVGGSLYIRSRAGQGTSVRTRLPIEGDMP